MAATTKFLVLPMDPKFELPNDSQLAYWSYAGKFSHFDRFVKMSSDLTVVETGPDPKDPNKTFVFCKCEKGMCGKVTSKSSKAAKS